MKKMMFAALAAAAFAAPAFGQESVEALRQPAIDSCKKAMADGSPVEGADALCVCLVDSIAKAIPGHDGVQMMKVLIANPTTDAETAAALGMPEAEAKAFMAKYEPVVAEAASTCVK